MSFWDTLFGEARGIVRSSSSLEDGVNRAVSVARANPGVFDPGYWGRVERHGWRDACAAVLGWARRGWQGLAKGECWSQDWELILLDLGDCPELYKLTVPGGQELMSEAKLRGLLMPTKVIESPELVECFGPGIAAPLERLFGSGMREVAYENVRRLGDDILSWNARGRREFHGANGYFLWLVVGSLALAAPLKDAAFREAVLRGRERLYLLTGFEAVFTWIATVTPTGLVFEDAAPAG